MVSGVKGDDIRIHRVGQPERCHSWKSDGDIEICGAGKKNATWQSCNVDDYNNSGSVAEWLERWIWNP